MFGDRGFQQGLLGEEPKGRQFLCDEGDAEEVHQQLPKGKHNLKLKRHLCPSESPLHCEVEPLLRNS